MTTALIVGLITIIVMGLLVLAAWIYLWAAQRRTRKSSKTLLGVVAPKDEDD